PPARTTGDEGPKSRRSPTYRAGARQVEPACRSLAKRRRAPNPGILHGDLNRDGYKGRETPGGGTNAELSDSSVGLGDYRGFYADRLRLYPRRPQDGHWRP